MTLPPADPSVHFSRRTCRCGCPMDPIRLLRGQRSWQCPRCGHASRR